MKNMKTSTNFYVIALAVVHTSGQSEKNIGCYIDGECMNSVSVGFYSSNGTSSCYDFCQTTNGCNYFTNYLSANLCFAFLDCVLFNGDNCDDCTSGESVCPGLLCAENNECIGTSLGFEILNSVGSCSQFCLDSDNCAWWTFDSSNSVCNIYQDCLATRDCSTCTSGQRKC